MAFTGIGTPISKLSEKTEPFEVDVMVIDGDVGTKKITFANILNAIKSKFTSWEFNGLNTANKNVVSAVNELDEECTKLYENMNDGCKFVVFQTICKISAGKIAESTVNFSGFTEKPTPFVTAMHNASTSIAAKVKTISQDSITVQTWAPDTISGSNSSTVFILLIGK